MNEEEQLHTAPGNIAFIIDDETVMKVDSDGSIRVRDVLVGNHLRFFEILQGSAYWDTNEGYNVEEPDERTVSFRWKDSEVFRVSSDSKPNEELMDGIKTWCSLQDSQS